MKRKVLLFMCLMAITFASAQVNSVALVGAAVGGWPTGVAGEVDVNQLTQVDADNWQIVDITIAVGPCKLRANNAWGGAGGEWAGAFPTAVGTSAGDISVPVAGVYTVTLNTATGVYNFTSGAPLPIVKLEGSAVADVNGLTLAPSGPDQFTATNVTLLAGTGQFSIDGTLYGGDTFPVGNATDPTLFVPVAAGDYTSITYNTGTGDYSFTLAPENPSIAIVGAATPFGWPTGTPGEVDAGVLTSTDGITYTGDFLLTAAGLKFRQENSWTNQWGGVSFPAGPAPGETNDIIVTVPGFYHVVLNRTTGSYLFSFNTIAIVGAGVGGWPAGTPGEIDANQMTTTDGENYILAAFTAVGGEAKFRQGNAWTLAWGGTAFPTGTGDTAGGSPNIPVPAGTYDITLNRTSGAYNFAPLATTSFSASNFKVYPNPTQNNWNFASAKESIQTIQIIDVLGKTVMTINPKNTTVNVDASSLNAGIYFAKIATATANTTVKVIKN